MRIKSKSLLNPRLVRILIAISILILVFYWFAVTQGGYPWILYFLVILQIPVVTILLKGYDRRISTNVMLFFSFSIIAYCIYMIVMGKLLLVGEGPIKPPY